MLGGETRRVTGITRKVVQIMDPYPTSQLIRVTWSMKRIQGHGVTSDSMQNFSHPPGCPVLCHEIVHYNCLSGKPIAEISRGVGTRLIMPGIDFFGRLLDGKLINPGCDGGCCFLAELSDSGGEQVIGHRLSRCSFPMAVFTNCQPL